MELQTSLTLIFMPRVPGGECELVRYLLSSMVYHRSTSYKFFSIPVAYKSGDILKQVLHFL